VTRAARTARDFLVGILIGVPVTLLGDASYLHLSGEPAFEGITAGRVGWVALSTGVAGALLLPRWRRWERWWLRANAA